MTFEFFVYFVFCGFRVFCGLKLKVLACGLGLDGGDVDRAGFAGYGAFRGCQRAWHCRDGKIFAKKRTTEKCAAL